MKENTQSTHGKLPQYLTHKFTTLYKKVLSLVPHCEFVQSLMLPYQEMLNPVIVLTFCKKQKQKKPIIFQKKPHFFPKKTTLFFIINSVKNPVFHHQLNIFKLYYFLFLHFSSFVKILTFFTPSDHRSI